MKIFVVPQDGELVGSVYFSGGGKGKGLNVKVLAPDNTELAVLQSDDQGNFHYTPRKRQSLRFVVKSGDGHRAEYVVQGEELSSDLDASADVSGKQAIAPVAPNKAPRSRDQQLVTEIGALRRELNEFESRIRLRDVLGGLGYILGLMGLVFYMKTRKERA